MDYSKNTLSNKIQAICQKIWIAQNEAAILKILNFLTLIWRKKEQFEEQRISWYEIKSERMNDSSPFTSYTIKLVDD